MDKKILLIGICDDEKEALNQIAESIKESIREMELPIHTKCRLFLNGEGMYQAIEKDAFDLLFVDIEMPGLNGFQLVKKISMRRKMPCLVFVSAYESFVFDSQEYMPLWFVRKSSLKRDMYRALYKYFEVKQPQKVCCFAQNDAKLQELYIHDIVYVESRGHAVYIQKTQGRVTKQYGSLKAFEKELAPHDFLRIHKSYLVNQEFIAEIGKKEVFLKDGSALEMGRDRRKSLCEAMARYERKHYGYQ